MCPQLDDVYEILLLLPRLGGIAILVLLALLWDYTCVMYVVRYVLGVGR